MSDNERLMALEFLIFLNKEFYKNNKVYCAMTASALYSIEAGLGIV